MMKEICPIAITAYYWHENLDKKDLNRGADSLL